MQVNVRAITTNQEVVDRCRVTVWKDSLGHNPSDKFMDDIYFSEHSPIRDKIFVVSLRDIPYWISVHLVRHSEGVTPYVSSQRDDRHNNAIPREEMPQGALVNMDMTVNAQAMINISRKRLCRMASKETMEIWKQVVKELEKVDEELAKNCVPNCVYRGGICPEGKNGCKYNQTECFKQELLGYLFGHSDNTYYKGGLINE